MNSERDNSKLRPEVQEPANFGWVKWLLIILGVGLFIFLADDSSDRV